MITLENLSEHIPLIQNLINDTFQLSLYFIDLANHLLYTKHPQNAIVFSKN